MANTNGNENNWKTFLSSIDKISTNHSTQKIITTKSKIKCLAEEFANQLLKEKGGTVKITGKQDVLNRYKHLDVSKNQTATPITKGICSQVKHQTLPKSKDETKGNIDEVTTTLARCQFFPPTSVSTKIKHFDAIIPEVHHTDTNEHVKETSVQNADAIMPEVPQIDTKENVNEASAQSADDISLRSIEVSVDNIPLVSDDIDIERTRHTNNDIDKSCSNWDVSSIAKYFNFKDCVFEITLPNKLPPCKDDILEMVQKDIRLRLNTVKSIDLTATEGTSESALLMQLKSIAITEAGSRLVLDPLLLFLCSGLGLQFEVEKNINCNFLPNCTFDYCIRKGKHIIGCIEAKSVTGLSSKSVAQAIIELMILQTTVIDTDLTETKKVDISKFPIFAIVTDGHRFIYIELEGPYLRFEHHDGRLKIREVTEEGDWKDILQLITLLVDKKRE